MFIEELGSISKLNTGFLQMSLKKLVNKDCSELQINTPDCSESINQLHIVIFRCTAGCKGQQFFFFFKYNLKRGIKSESLLLNVTETECKCSLAHVLTTSSLMRNFYILTLNCANAVF